MFHVTTREQAEKAMQEKEFEWAWDDSTGNCTVISKVLPAVIVSSNSNKVFFNQVIAAYTGWVDKRNQYGKSVVFGDGEPISPELISSLAAFMDANKCAYSWTSGQFCIIDNTVAYHSRQPFTGKRRVFAAIANGTKPVEDLTTNLVLSSGKKLPSVGAFAPSKESIEAGIKHIRVSKDEDWS